MFILLNLARQTDVSWWASAGAVLLTHATIKTLPLTYGEARGRYERKVFMYEPLSVEAREGDHVSTERQSESRLASHHGHGVPAEDSGGDNNNDRCIFAKNLDERQR